MELDELEKLIPTLRFGGRVPVRSVGGTEPLNVTLGIGDGGRGQKLEITSRWTPYVVIRSKVCAVDDLPGDDPLSWMLTENAGSGLGAIVVRGRSVWIEMVLLADYVDRPELALAIEAVGLEADRLEAKMSEGRDRY